MDGNEEGSKRKSPTLLEGSNDSMSCNNFTRFLGICQRYNPDQIWCGREGVRSIQTHARIWRWPEKNLWDQSSSILLVIAEFQLCVWEEDHMSEEWSSHIQPIGSWICLYFYHLSTYILSLFFILLSIYHSIFHPHQRKFQFKLGLPKIIQIPCHHVLANQNDLKFKKGAPLKQFFNINLGIGILKKSSYFRHISLCFYSNFDRESSLDVELNSASNEYPLGILLMGPATPEIRNTWKKT